MPTPTQTSQLLEKALRKKKILTIQDLCQIAHRSPMTVWRILKPIGYYSSFNFNARYYTLAEIPRFDAQGLWFYRDVGFSSCRSLTRTIVALIEQSKMGMTQNELSALLHVRVQNQLYHLFAQGKMDRLPWGRAHLYLSLQEERREEQLRRRKATQALPAPQEAPLSDSETIAILAELLRAPGSSARRVAIVLSTGGLAITRQKVLAVIEKYDLPKKGASRRSRS